MGAETFLLDSSALLTLIEDELGAERVEQVLRSSQTLLPWVAVLEVVYITRQERGEAEADRRYALIKQLPSRIIWGADEPVLLTAARFKAAYRLSLADAIMAAFAVHADAVLLHKDPELAALDGQVALEALPFKAAEPPG